MNQPITGFHLDSENHWVADLECGHAQHVRHDPPFFQRPWVLTTEGRTEHMGQPLNCVRCDEMRDKIARATIKQCQKALAEGYESAGLSGLCDEGRWEAALGSLETIDVTKLSW